MSISGSLKRDAIIFALKEYESMNPDKLSILYEPGAINISFDETHDIESFSLDSRKLDKHTAFVAFKGEHFDANDCVIDALSLGSPLVMMSQKLDRDADGQPSQELLELQNAARANQSILVYAQDPTELLQSLALAYRLRLKLKACIGITGSVGKTTTKEMMSKLARLRYKTHATTGNFNNELGLPLTILSAPQDTEILILEMGMSALGEIAQLASIAKPSLGIITNVGVSHLGKLGSRENIARAKFELAQGLQPGSSLIVHEEDDYFEWMKAAITEQKLDLELLSYSSAAVDYELDELGRPEFGYKGVQFKLSVPGVHNIANALACITAAESLGIELTQAAQALHEKLPSSGRQDIIECKGVRIVDDSYNANPVSMLASLKAFASMKCEGKKYAVLGDMGELGEQEAQLHAEVGTQFARLILDKSTATGQNPKDEESGLARPNIDTYLICVGKLSHEIAKAANFEGLPESNIIMCGSIEEALQELKDLKAGDAVLVKASRSAGLERVVKGLVERANW